MCLLVFELRFEAAKDEAAVRLGPATVGVAHRGPRVADCVSQAGERGQDGIARMLGVLC